MYVGRQHTVTSTARKLSSFRCLHCNAESRAFVVGVGQDRGNSPYFLDEAGAKDRAHATADDAAEENTRLTLSLARCPTCQKRDEGALRAVKGKALAGVVAALALLPLLGIFFDGLKGTSAWCL